MIKIGSNYLSLKDTSIEDFMVDRAPMIFLSWIGTDEIFIVPSRDGLRQKDTIRWVVY